MHVFASGRRPSAVDTMPEPSPFALDLEHLVGELGRAYRTATPFPHIVIEDVFHDDVLDGVLNEWPSRDGAAWNSYDDPSYERGKLTCSDVEHLGPTTLQLLTAISSPRFLEFLEALTGIPGLIPDPYFAAAGLFEVTDGGFLNIHGDFNINQRTGLDRRCNVLVYLNRNWTEANGGQLEFWSARPLQRTHRIIPTFNRTVIFDTTPKAFHGHPVPVTTNGGANRKAVSAYYFTRGRPLKEQFLGAQGNRVPGDRPSRRAQLRALGKAMTPPVLLEAAKQVGLRLRAGGVAQQTVVAGITLTVAGAVL